MICPMNRLSGSLAGAAALAALLLGGCSDSRMTAGVGTPAPAARPLAEAPAPAARPMAEAPAAGPVAQAPAPAARPVAQAPAPVAKPVAEAPAPAARTTLRQSIASAALDDSRLGEIRGGLNTGSGLVVNFSFQEATYINHSLAQSIVVPTVTVAPGSGGAGSGTSSVTVGGLPPTTGSGITQAQVSSPALAVQSLVNSGMTSVVSSLGGGGVTNTITNSANNQLVQQVITANINITGLSQTIQQSVASTVLSRVAAANSQFR